MTGAPARWRGWAPAAVALLGVCMTAPLLLFRALPGQDLPNHFAIVATLARRASDPAWNELFASRLGLSEYSGFYLVATGLARAVGADLACRLVLAAYVVGLPLSVWYFARASVARGAAAWAGLLACAFVFGDAYLVGFAPYLLSLPLVFVGAGMALRAAREDVVRYGRVVGLAVIGLLAYVVHPLGAVLLLGAAGGVAVLFAARSSRLALVVGALLPTALLIGNLALRDASGGVSRLPGGFKLDYLLRTPIFMADARPGWLWFAAVAVPAALLVGALGVAAVVALRQSARRPVLRLERAHVGWLVLGLGALYFVAPFHLGSALWFDLRLAPLVWLFACVACAPAIARNSVARVAVVGFVVASCAASGATHYAFDREAAPVFDAIADMEPNRRVLSVVADGSSETLRPIHVREDRIGFYSPHVHLASYYHLAKGGVSPLMAFHRSLSWIPLEVRPGVFGGAFVLADSFDAYRLVGALSETRHDFDYVLVRGVDARMGKVLARGATLVSTYGPYSLYTTGRSSGAAR